MTAWDKRDDMIVHESEPFNAEPPPGALAAAPLTPHESFYVRSHGPIPCASAAAWTVRIGGLVRRPLHLSLDELKSRFSTHTVTATLQCAGNRRAGLIGVRAIPGEAPWGPAATATACWRGIRLADLLTAAEVADDAHHVEFVGADRSDDADPPQRFGSSIPRHKALATEVLLAWEMNGAPLPREHGGPLRVVVPGYIGARSVKWVERINALAEPSRNYFQMSSYRLLTPDTDPDAAEPGAGVALGAVALNSDILVPADGARVKAGRIAVSGYAYAGDDRRVVRVDVSSNGGVGWIQARLLEDLGPWAWRRWEAEFDLSPGPAELVARAWDSAAATQPESAAQLWNPKGYANNSWARVRIEAA